MIVKESKNLFHLVGIVMSRAGRSGARRHSVINSWRLEIFTQYNFWRSEATTLVVVSIDSSDRNLYI
jgi:hypothetical protein